MRTPGRSRLTDRQPSLDLGRSLGRRAAFDAADRSVLPRSRQRVQITNLRKYGSFQLSPSGDQLARGGGAARHAGDRRHCRHLAQDALGRVLTTLCSAVRLSVPAEPAAIAVPVMVKLAGFAYRVSLEIPAEAAACERVEYRHRGVTLEPRRAEDITFVRDEQGRPMAARKEVYPWGEAGRGDRVPSCPLASRRSRFTPTSPCSPGCRRRWRERALSRSPLSGVSQSGDHFRYVVAPDCDSDPFFLSRSYRYVDDRGVCGSGFDLQPSRPAWKVIRPRFPHAPRKHDGYIVPFR